MRVIIPMLFLMVYSCNQLPDTDSVWKGYNPRDLETAWNEKDSNTIIKWINSLSDTSLSDIDFYNRVTFLSDVTNFKYGNADPVEKVDGFYLIPKKIREMHKRNTATMYMLYSKSKLFMQPANYEETILLQDKYWNDTTVFDLNQTKLILKAIDSLYKK